MEPLINTPQPITKQAKQAPPPTMTSESGQRAAAEKEEQLPCPCPRCHSTDTKFCYYNNYNLSQPRHFCKSCRRYWTRGGALRDVPVGGATRKASSSNNNNNKRRRTTTTTTTTNSIENNNSNEVITCQSDQTRPVYPDSAACDESAWWGGQLGGLFPLNEYGLDLANGPMSVGGKVECEESFGCDTWHVGGGVEGSMVEGDYFSWPELAMSTPPKALMK